MYEYKFDEETGGILLTDTEMQTSKEPRPVFAEEMNILGFNRRWNYKNQNKIPYLWAEAGNYFYRGKKIAVVKGGSLYEKPELKFVEENGLAQGEIILPIDLKKMVEKNFDLMENLRQATIKRIYNYWRKNKNLDCFHVAFSGGKDSVVLLDLVKHALPKSAFIVFFSDTHMEFPDTYKIIDKVEKNCVAEGIEFHRTASKLLPEESWKLFGPPATVLRWCCSVHKSAPQTLKIREILNKTDFVGADFVGVRAQESARRSEYEVENFGKKQRGQYSHNSILEWSSAEIWLYIFMKNLLFNDCYKKGNSRAGCLLCPMISGKANFFRKNSYSVEVEKFVNFIRENIVDENIDSYITNGGWNSRRNGRDLKNPVNNYSEKIDGDYFYIKVENPKSDWQEWFKTLGEVHFPYRIKTDVTNQNLVKVKVNSSLERTPALKNLKFIFHKAAACVNCGVCESNCKFGAISFENGLYIDEKKCTHCLECLKIPEGCERYNSTRFFISEGYRMKSINNFADHAPLPEWIKNFFDEPEKFLDNNQLGKNQFTHFKRFLFDAELVDRKSKTPTNFTELIKKIGWKSATAWGLILINLVHNNPQIRWYIENLPINEGIDRATVEKILQSLKISEKDSKSIVKAFKRLCEIPLGTELNFGTTTSEEKKFLTLRRTKARVDDGRVILYALYKFAEAAGGWYQFNLSRLMNDINSAGVSPAKIFGIERAEMQQFLNGLSANYPEFINATFTHDLEKISLIEEKNSQDVLNLFA